MTWLSQIFSFFRAFQCWLVVAPWESALRVRAGKTSKTLGPGIHLRIPFLDRLFVQATRLRSISDSGQTMSSIDGKTLTVSVSLMYSIQDIAKLYLSVSNPEATLLAIVQGAISEFVSTTHSTSLSPKAIQDSVTDKIDTDKFGLGDVRLVVTTFCFVKTYRLLNYEYRTLSRANELEQDKAA